MKNSQYISFFSPKKFFDNTNYPYGFARSGDFTRTQADLLEQYGYTLQRLYRGEQTPANTEEHSFVRVCHQDAEPSSAIERTWMTYLKATERRQQFFTAATSAGLGQSLTNGESINDDD